MSQTFHDDSEVPAGPNFDDAVALSLGFRFSVGVAGTVTHARFRAADTVSGDVKWGLYRQSDTSLLTVQTYSSYTVSAWNTFALPAGIPIVPTESYMAVYWTPNKYVATPAYFGSPITRGDITAEASAGRFSTGPDIAYPGSAFNNGCYFTDLVFQPDSGLPSASPSGQAIPVSLGTPTAALGLSTTPGGLAVPVALGQPAAALGRTAAPGGLAIPVALGQPTVGPAGVSPSGLAIPLSLGQPSASLARVATPTGLAIPVAIGQPSTLAPVATDAPGHVILASSGRGRPIVATPSRQIIVASSGGQAATS
jgi:hypothetical protein